MTTFAPANDAALSGDIVTIFGAVELTLPSRTVRLLDGAGVVSWSGKTFAGQDEVLGTLASIDELGDGMGDDAPAVRVAFHPESNAATAALAGAAMQGSRVAIYLGVLDQATGAPIATPELIGLYELDVPSIRVGAEAREVQYDCVSAFERFFDNDEGARLSDAFHQSIWPGERGMEFATGVDETVYWGVEPPRPAITSGVDRARAFAERIF